MLFNPNMVNIANRTNSLFVRKYTDIDISIMDEMSEISFFMCSIPMLDSENVELLKFTPPSPKRGVNE